MWEQEKKIGREKANEINLKGRKITAIDYAPLCVKTDPCQHAWFTATLDDGTSLTPKLNDGAAFAHFLLSLDARDLVADTHFAFYMEME